MSKNDWEIQSNNVFFYLHKQTYLSNRQLQRLQSAERACMFSYRKLFRGELCNWKNYFHADIKVSMWTKAKVTQRRSARKYKKTQVIMTSRQYVKSICVVRCCVEKCVSFWSMLVMSVAYLRASNTSCSGVCKTRVSHLEMKYLRKNFFWIKFTWSSFESCWILQILCTLNVIPLAVGLYPLVYGHGWSGEFNNWFAQRRYQ